MAHLRIVRKRAAIRRGTPLFQKSGGKAPKGLRALWKPGDSVRGKPHTPDLPVVLLYLTGPPKRNGFGPARAAPAPAAPQGRQTQQIDGSKKTETLPTGRSLFSLCEKAELQQDHAGVLTGLDGLLVPGTGLDLADVGLAQQQHGQSGLANAAADGQRQLAGQQSLVEG